MQKLLDHPRFWLFAPFIGLLGLTLIALGFWHMASDRITDRLAAQGLSWQRLTPQGFPARITLDVDAPRLRRDDRLWQNQAMRLTFMPFNHRHAVVDFTGPHRLETPQGELQLAHQGNLMSLVTDGQGLQRGSFEAQQPVLNGRWQNRPLTLQAKQMGMHMRRGAAPGRVDAALVLKDLQTVPQGTQIERFDMLTDIPESWLQAAPQAQDRIKLLRLTVERAGLTLVVRGSVKLAASGFLDGQLDVDVLNQAALLDTLQDFGWLAPQQRRQAAFLFGLGAAFGGDTQDRLSVPISLKDGRVFLGPLDVAAAPRWQ